MEEIWKDIVGFEGLYKVSNLGRVKSLFRYKIILKPLKHTEGYSRYGLCINGKKIYKYGHKLVAEAFFGNNINLIVNHKNGIKTDNRLKNLEYISHRCNNIHAYKLGLQKPRLGKNNALSKKVNQFNLNGNFIKTWDSMKDIQRNIGIAYPNISACCLGKANTAGGFIWKFYK